MNIEHIQTQFAYGAFLGLAERALAGDKQSMEIIQSMDLPKDLKTFFTIDSMALAQDYSFEAFMKKCECGFKPGELVTFLAHHPRSMGKPMAWNDMQAIALRSYMGELTEETLGRFNLPIPQYTPETEFLSDGRSWFLCSVEAGMRVARHFH